MKIQSGMAFAVVVLILCFAQIDTVYGWSYGCSKGLCWAGCGFGWCYTARSGESNFASCKRKVDCNEDWKCAGLCSA